jgi:hypothetical protein
LTQRVISSRTSMSSGDHSDNASIELCLTAIEG